MNTTKYCVMFWAKRWRVRPELWAVSGQVATDYLRACKIVDYMNLRASRVYQSSDSMLAIAA